MTRLTTTQRGLGGSHQADRRRQLAALRPGQPCPRCGTGMYPWQRLDLDDYPGRVFGGPQVKRLAHARCNRQAGARLGNRLRRMRRLAMARDGEQARLLSTVSYRTW